MKSSSLSSPLLLGGILFACWINNAKALPFFNPVPKEYINPREFPHPQCPVDSHILGHGSGSTEQEAREKARSDVLRQIRSKIESEVERVSTVTQSGKKEFSQTSLQSTITETATFDYGE